MKKTADGCFLSVYTDAQAPPDVIFTQINRLASVFTENSRVFWDLAAERISANNFTERRLKDAVNNILDNFQYNKIKISDIIGFDKKQRFYDYPEVCRMWRDGYYPSDFETRKIDGNVYWVKKADLLNK